MDYPTPNTVVTLWCQTINAASVGYSVEGYWDGEGWFLADGTPLIDRVISWAPI